MTDVALRAVMKGTGSALPENRVSNAELAARVDTSDEWIVERTVTYIINYIQGVKRKF